LSPLRIGQLRLSRSVWLLLVLALLVRLAFVAATPNYLPLHDDHDYDRLACGIVDGVGYRALGPATPPGACGSAGRVWPPTAYRPPAYPALLAGVYAATAPLHGDRWTAARIVQALLGTIAAALVGLVAMLLWGRTTGLAALALAAVHLPFAMVGAALVSETLFITFEMGAVVCALLAGRSAHPLRWIAATGVLAGLAWLTRSNGVLLLLPLALAAWSAMRGRGRGRSAAAAVGVLLVAAALTIAPWTARNADVFAAFVPVSTETGPTLIGTYNDVARKNPVDPGSWWLPRDVPTVRAYLVRHRGEPSRDSGLTAKALDYAATHPAYVVRVLVRNTLRLADLMPPSDWRQAGVGIDMPPAAGVTASAWFLAVLALALTGVATGAARGAPRWLWAIPALLFLSVALVIAGVRFRMPVEPFVVLLAGAGLAELVSRVRATRAPPARARIG
jgi:hypothetical protein